MSQVSNVAPQSVRHYLSRAKSLLKRNETQRALEALVTGLDLYDPKKLLIKARVEIEFLIIECVNDIGRQPAVRHLLSNLAKSSKAAVSYKPGEEDKLKATLKILLKGLKGAEEDKIEQAKMAVEARQEELQQRGLAHLKAGDMAKGKAALRVLGDEFGHEPGVYSHIGVWLQEAGLIYDAVEFLELSIENFPKISKAYGAATTIYMETREFDKAEAVYTKAIKEFGKHPRTMLNMAKMYLAWNKKDKAFECAQSAYNADNSLDEAKELVDKLG